MATEEECLCLNELDSGESDHHIVDEKEDCFSRVPKIGQDSANLATSNNSQCTSLNLDSGSELPNTLTSSIIAKEIGTEVCEVSTEENDLDVESSKPITKTGSATKLGSYSVN